MPPNESVQVPHGVLTNYYRREEDRRAYVERIFNQTAADYDRVERIVAFGSGSWYRHRALTEAGLEAGMSVLDIGTGTGLVAREAVKIVGDAALVIGVDPSAGMIDNAKVPAGVRLLAGSAESIPLAAASADFLCMGYALRHVSDLSAAFREFHRVLKVGGRVCLLEISRPDSAIQRVLLKFHMRSLVPLASRLVARHAGMPELMRYYWDTIEACAAPTAIIAGLSGAGFSAVERRVDLGIFSSYHARK
jgi:demethylmenaquinone methyltransferase/2-methoxy-6-polyprenyl-1,4-benzoquinol methylase